MTVHGQDQESIAVDAKNRLGRAIRACEVVGLVVDRIEGEDALCGHQGPIMAYSIDLSHDSLGERFAMYASIECDFFGSRTTWVIHDDVTDYYIEEDSLVGCLKELKRVFNLEI